MYTHAHAHTGAHVHTHTHMCTRQLCSYFPEWQDRAVWSLPPCRPGADGHLPVPTPLPAAATTRPLNPAGPCPPPVGLNRLLPRCGVRVSFLPESLQSQEAGCCEPRSQARPASSRRPARGWTPGRLPTTPPGPWPLFILAAPSQTQASGSGVLHLPYPTPPPKAPRPAVLATQPQARPPQAPCWPTGSLGGWGLPAPLHNHLVISSTTSLPCL